MFEKIVKVMPLDPRGITILPDRVRKLRPEVVTELAASIKQRGLLQPIVVRPRKTGYTLIAGWHRLMAARQLKLSSIRASVLEGLDADQAELAEIDENLVRADLSPAERALHMARRKELYEKAHPETKPTNAGGPGRAKTRRQNGDDTDRFTKDTAKKSGKSERAVQRDVARAKGCIVLAEIAGTSLDKGDEIDALTKLPAKEQRELAKAAAKGKKVSAKPRVKQEKRAAKERELGNTIAKQLGTTGKRYGVIYADAPWRFEPYNRESGMDRAADNHYPTMTLKKILALKVPAAKDCVLFLWATVPMLPQALDVMARWKFTYRSHFVWVKDRIGTGYWTRNQHELLLIGTRGNIPAPAQGEQYSSMQTAPLGKHSAKPPLFAEIIEDMFPTLPRLEMFARAPRLGWDVMGNESS